jgi:hypothetical protein
MKFTRQLPSFNGVAPTGVATLNLPIGLSYHKLLLTRGGTTFNHDMMTNIVLKANGKPIYTATGAELDDFNAHDRLAVGDNTTGLSVLDFERAGLLNRSWVEASKIGTGMPKQSNPNGANYNPEPITSLTLEVTITGATAPTLTAKAIQSPRAPSLGFIKLRKYTGYAPGAGGVFEISDLPVGDLINRIWVHGAGDYVDAVELQKDNFTVFERTEEENELIQSNGVKTPVAKYFVIDPTEEGVGNDAIASNVQDFRLKVTVSEAESLIVFVEYIGDLRGN